MVIHEEKRKVLADYISDVRASASGFEVNGAGVYRVIQIANKKPYVCISASRLRNKDKTLRTPEENRKKNAELLSDIKKEGLYAYEMVGGTTEGYCKECGEAMPEDECGCGSTDRGERHVVESSYFVPFDGKRDLTDFINLFVHLRDHYEQDAILVGLPKAYDYKGWEPPYGLIIGNHYGLNRPSNSADIYGTEATIKTFDKFGSIAIDPKKNRTIDWVVAGVSVPQTALGAFGMQKKGLRWFWDDIPEPKASDFEGETKQRAAQKILGS